MVRAFDGDSHVESEGTQRSARSQGGNGDSQLKDRDSPHHTDVAPGIEWAEALEQVGGDEELLQELLSAFMSEWPRLAKEIREAISEDDARRLEHAAHSFKGSAGAIAAWPAFDAAQRLELMGRAGDLTAANPACAELEDRLHQLKGTLTQR